MSESAKFDVLETAKRLGLKPRELKKALGIGLLPGWEKNQPVTGFATMTFSESWIIAASDTIKRLAAELPGTTHPFKQSEMARIVLRKATGKSSENVGVGKAKGFALRSST